MSRPHKQTLLTHLQLKWEYQKNASQNFDAKSKKFFISSIIFFIISLGTT